jgi:hypothetical protein
LFAGLGNDFIIAQSASPGCKLSAEAPASSRAYAVTYTRRFLLNSLSENCEITEKVSSNPTQKEISTKEAQQKQSD